MNHIRRRFILCIVLMAGIALSCAGMAEAEWERIYNSETDGYDFYYVDESGDRVTGWQTIDGRKYYFLENGKRADGGWLMLGSEKYFLIPYAATGSIRINNKETGQDETFLFGKDGKLQSGWVSIESENYAGEKVTRKYYCGEDGKQVTGFVTIGGKRYFFNPSLMTGTFFQYDEETKQNIRYYADENGVIQTGWVEVDGERLYYDEDGKRLTGWQEIDGAKYYLKPSPAIGKTRINENGTYHEYYFDNDGKMQFGWVETDDTRLYYGEDGKRLTGWQEIDGARYYLNPSPAIGEIMLHEDDSYNSYYFDKNGIMQTGWVDIDRETDEGGMITEKYYFGKDGKRISGFLTIEKNKYYFSPSLAIGFFTCYDKETGQDAKYYADENGVIQTDLIIVDGKIYFFNEDGTAKAGWQEIDDKWYYFKNILNEACTGLIYIDGERYFFAEDGTMQTGPIAIDGKIHFFDTDGKEVTGWQETGGKWYYIDKYWKQAYTGLSYIDGRYYFFAEDGAMQTGWINASEYYGWRLFNENGAMLESFAGMSSVSIPEEVDYLKDDTFAGIGRDFIVNVVPGSYAEYFARRIGLQYSDGQKTVSGYQIKSVSEKVQWVVDNYTDEDMSDLEKVRALHDWLIHNAHYDTTYSIHSASGVLLGASGVCTSYADAYQLLLNAAGIENRYVSGSADNGSGGGAQGHAWNMVKLGDNWYHVDCTWDDPTNRYRDDPIISGVEGYGYFLISDEKIGKNHFWWTGIKALEDMNWRGEPGWQQKGADWFYYDRDGIMTTGAARVDGILYGFRDDGRLMTAGWQKVNGRWYRAAEGGILTENTWLQEGGAWYYMGKNGAMKTGWVQIDGEWYYFSENGAMQTGWLQAGDSWYLLKADGSMATGWAEAGGAWFCFSDTGVMQTGWIEDNGSWYFLDSSGVMQTGWQQIDGKWYYFKDDGKMAAGEWVGSYYMGASGAMSTGWLKDNGKWYYLNADGIMQTGWLQDGENWYYLNAGGRMVTGQAAIDGRNCIFDAGGVWLGYAD